MSPSQSTEALLAFVACIIVGLLPGLLCAFRLLARSAFQGVLWNSKHLISSPRDAVLLIGIMWPMVLFPLAANIVDSRLEYYFPFGGLQPGWLHFAFAAFPYIVLVLLPIALFVWLPYGIRADQAMAARELADRTY